jgi:hypothetical protein
MSTGFKITLAIVLVAAGLGYYILLSPSSSKLSSEEEARANAQRIPVATHPH